MIDSCSRHALRTAEIVDGLRKGFEVLPFSDDGHWCRCDLDEGAGQAASATPVRREVSLHPR